MRRGRHRRDASSRQSRPHQGDSTMTATEAAPLDTDKLMGFVFRAVDEVGATLNTALAVMGDKLGYYKLLADEPLTATQLAERSGTGEHYAREWANAQAAGGWVT